MELAVLEPICRHCCQYEQDCECCKECGCVDVHEYGCGEAETRVRHSAFVPRYSIQVDTTYGSAETAPHVLGVRW